MPFGQMQETLLSGRVDMGLFPQPFYGAINATGEVKPMFRLTDLIDPFVQLLNGCRRDFIYEHEPRSRPSSGTGCGSRTGSPTPRTARP